jgi:hypothetical protein
MGCARFVKRRCCMPSIFSNNFKMISEKRLRCYVSDESIYSYYFGDFEIGRKYNSPLRRDPKPSFLIQEYNGFLFWKDFGLSTTNRPDALGFVAELFNETRGEALRRVWNDFLKGGVRVYRKKRPLNIGLPYDINVGDLMDWELGYWDLHCLRETVGQFGVKGLRGLYRHGSLLWESTIREPAYVYSFGKDRFKVYRPLSEDRFRGQSNGDCIEGYDQLPLTAPLLIITSSMKDAMVLTSLGYPACAPPSENSFRPLLERAREFNARFHQIVTLLDNDGPGRRAAKRIEHSTNWRGIFTPGFKDPADVIKKFGNRFVLKNILVSLLYENSRHRSGSKRSFGYPG